MIILFIKTCMFKVCKFNLIEIGKMYNETLHIFKPLSFFHFLIKINQTKSV